MLIRIVIGLVVGFAVGVPSAVSFLNKARIKTKIRHIQGSLVLGLLSAFFVFLLQTCFALQIIFLAVSLCMVCVALEIMLRRIVEKSYKQKLSIEMGPNGSQVSFEQSRIDSGLYPADYLTEDIWTEMGLFLKERARQSKPSVVAEKVATKTDGISDKKLRGYQIYAYVNINGPNFSISNGIRNTTDINETMCVNKVFIFGGSTVFCDEMPDRLTVASFLQRLIVQAKRSTAVVNCGWSGASIIDRSKMLKDLVKIKSGDKVVFYFGDNDSGWTHAAQDEVRLSEDLMPLPLQFMKVLYTMFGFEIACWVYKELSPKWMRKYAQLAVIATIDALNDASEYCKKNGVEMLVILQPNLYTLRTKYPSEEQAEKRFSNNLKTAIRHAYEHYEEWVKETPYAVSATHIFDNAEAPVFLDWAHVNARGNEIIAKFIFDELKKRELVSGSIEV